jgi:hypothetical protein
MNKTEQAIVGEVINNGGDPKELVKQYNKGARAFNKAQKAAGSSERKAITSKKIIESYLNQLDEIESWGFKDYVTHAMKGNIALVDEKGNIIMFSVESD